MMFADKVQKRLHLLRPECIDVSDKQLRLTEASEQGAAELQMDLRHPCILFRNLEKKKLQYFKNEKCADYIIFENRKQAWVLHIIEFKKTVTASKWEEEIKSQFRGAMQNALAIAGFMDIPIELSQTVLYTAYRNDKINDMANPVKIRRGMHERDLQDISAKGNDWNEEKVRIDYLDTDYLRHTRIPLDIADGRGRAALAGYGP